MKEKTEKNAQDYEMRSREYLHSPDRAASMLSIEDHISAAANFSRALWLLLANEDAALELGDKRNAAAVAALADLVADHASAADYLSHLGNVGIYPPRPRVVAGTKA